MPSLLSWPGYEPVDVGVGMADRVAWEFHIYSDFITGTLENVNEAVNHEIKYVPDVGDYWQSPDETWRRKAGDCEDFCIAKYAMLKRLGYTDMAMVVGQDVWDVTDGRRQVHALLFVGPHDGIVRPNPEILVLDNRTPLIHDAAYYHKFFTPMYAVDEHKTWFYRKV